MRQLIWQIFHCSDKTYHKGYQIWSTVFFNSNSLFHEWHMMLLNSFSAYNVALYQSYVLTRGCARTMIPTPVTWVTWHLKSSTTPLCGQAITKKTSMHHINGPLWGECTSDIGGFPSQRASNVENISWTSEWHLWAAFIPVTPGAHQPLLLYITKYTPA